ncbi:phBC6A51 family helix-turn-helix protein [Priestia flexa]|uniref:phBC6A51 family helix-turn-helix protein n=1 Tax=Priestia flexa TaxID=86664 RepID=UPI00099C20D6|nr:phBC6A51 family helix-turn-helix protein [Priestia flexa]AQX56041.1 hypothetical protein BC359_18175 [Priestia flexa]
MTSGKYDKTELHLQGVGTLSTNMQIAAELLALPSRGGFSLKEISEKASISERQLRNWRNDSRFQNLVAQKTRQNVKEVIPNVLEAVVQRAIEGSAKHAELVLKYEGLLTDRHEVVATVPEQTRHDVSEFDRINDELERELKELKDLIGKVDEEDLDN